MNGEIDILPPLLPFFRYCLEPFRKAVAVCIAGKEVSMDLVSPIIEIVKLVGGPVWRYLKAQTKFNKKLDDFNQHRDNFLLLEERIQSRLGRELQIGRKIAQTDVETWLSAAGQEIAKQSVEDEVSGRGCLSCCCRPRILEKRTLDLMLIYENGNALNRRDCLVDDDFSAILEDNVKDFQKWKKKLRGALQDVRGKLSSQLGFGKMDTEQVKIWLEEVEEITGPVAQSVEDQVRSGSTRHSEHASLGSLVRAKIEDMKELCNEGGRLLKISLVVDDPASALELPTSELQDRDAVKAEILECLMGDEVTKLGVWGMAGVGKTTVMEHVYNHLLKESKFKKVIWVTVSQTFDVQQIQQKIASRLEEETAISKHQESVVRAAMLLKMLEEHMPCLVILDDVWRSFELKDVGIPESLGCKIVLTTRSEEVVRAMDCKTIKVTTLSPEASLKLFSDNVGDIDFSDGGGIRKTLKLIVEECDGLPLAIKTVACSMKRISEPSLWSAALKQLRLGRRTVAGTDGDEFRVLKFSYDWLNNKEIQCCFLHCAMYPEDEKIRQEYLIDFWIDEELIHGMETREEMVNEGYAILKKLEENCLLEFVKDDDGASQWDCVRMHDLFRDMAIHITRSSGYRFLMKAGVGLKELPEEHEWKEDLLKVSLMSNKIEEIPPSVPSPRCPMLTTLLLLGMGFTTIPELFFEHMHQLKVLDLSYNHALKSLPSSVSKLVKLTTLLLRNCFSLKELPYLSDLVPLKRLDLAESGVVEVPQGLEKLINLKYLSCGNSKMVTNAVTKWEMAFLEILPNLSKLQFLRIHHRLSLKGEALRGLSKLETLFCRFSTARDMGTFLQSRRVSLWYYRVFAGRYYHEFLRWDGKESLGFHDTDICGEPNLLLPNVRCLRIHSCNDARSLSDVSGIEDAKELQMCIVEKCKGMVYVFSQPNQLKEVPEGLQVKDSTISQATSGFQNLEMLRVRHCEHLEEIMTVSSSSEEERELSGVVILPKLKMLMLLHLPALRRICSPTSELSCDLLDLISIVNCPNLEMQCLFSSRFNPLQTLKTLTLVGVRNLKSVFDEESTAFWRQSSTASFPLERIKVKNCPKLKTVFPAALLLLGYFRNVRKICVARCDELEEIISSSPEEEEDGSLKLIHLPKLEDLYLYNLPKLKRVCSSSSGLVCNLLENLGIGNSKMLKRIPLHLPQSDNGQLASPPSLECIFVSKEEKEWWESLEWDQPNAKNVLSRFCCSYLEYEDAEVEKIIELETARSSDPSSEESEDWSSEGEPEESSSEEEPEEPSSEVEPEESSSEEEPEEPSSEGEPEESSSEEEPEESSSE